MKKQRKQYTYRKRISLLLLMLCCTIFAFGQQSAIVTGRVIDGQGKPIVGASVSLKKKSNSATTDPAGNFKITVEDVSRDILVISYIGFEPIDLPLEGKRNVNVTLQESATELEEVAVVAFGVQKKETLTGAISSVKTEALLRSPNASVANSLAGQITGLSSNATSGQPGAEDPSIFIRGIGSLTTAASAPLILVDGVERSFFQMDPNEIERVTVLKDASATAVFGVRGANGVIMVTTRRGKEGKAKIDLTSSVGMTQPTRMLEMTDSYNFARLYNEMRGHDGQELTFDDYELERFRLGDEPILYPNVNMRDYMMQKASAQTQHNINISGGTDNVKYFISTGFLHQNGLMKQFKELDYNNNYNYARYNYRANMDMDLSKATVLKLGLGGIVGQRHEPGPAGGGSGIFKMMNLTQPMATPGIIDGRLVLQDRNKFSPVLMDNIALNSIYGKGYSDITSNTMNMDLALTQKLDFMTKGLSAEVKGAYNTNYSYAKDRRRTYVETYYPYYQSFLEGVHTEIDHPIGDEAGYNKDIAYKIANTDGPLGFDESTGRGRDWYLEASLRYNRSFGGHNIGGLLLYNQSKKYYPSQYIDVPSAYVGLVGRMTYDYKSRYMAEFNFGYNGSENFAPDKRYGAFPAGSVGYILTEESFMKNQNVVDFLKMRASVGLVGNDNISGNRFLYLSDSYNIDQGGLSTGWNAPMHGYNFGSDARVLWNGAFESRIGNRNVTWETALKQNYGLEIHFLKSRLKTTVDVFYEDRKDILINRSTIPALISLTSGILPVVNMGRVKNQGYEIELKWNDQINDFRYWVDANMSYSKNRIIFQDEVEPNEPYLWRTGTSVGTVFGYIDEGFYTKDDFEDLGTGRLKEGLADPKVKVAPGDVKYRDLNNDGIIDTDDQQSIGYPTIPAYTFGFNYGAEYKGWFLTMNWTAVTERSLVLNDQFRRPFWGGLMEFHKESRWTEDRADIATTPRLSKNSEEHNSKQSTMWLRDGNYLRLKTVTVGYNFANRPALQRLGISSLGLRLSGYNLLTFDKFKIIDPESLPTQFDTYPLSKIYNLGVNITF